MRSGDLFEINSKPLSWEVPPHWHDYFELEVITDGGMIEYTINGQTHFLQRGAAYFAAPQDVQSIKPLSEIKLYSISFSEMYIAEPLLALLRRPETGKIAIFPTDVFQKLSGMLELMQAEFSGDAAVRRELLLAMMSAVLYLYVEYARAEDASVGRVDLLPSNVATIINASFREKLTVKSIAEKLHLTPNYVGERFKQVMGMSINDYLMERRLSNAYNLLYMGHCNVAEAAENSGFASASYFSSAFKKCYGYPPGDLRQTADQRKPGQTGSSDTPSTTTQHSTATLNRSAPNQAAAMPATIAEPPASGESVTSSIAGNVITASVT